MALPLPSPPEILVTPLSTIVWKKTNTHLMSGIIIVLMMLFTTNITIKWRWIKTKNIFIIQRGLYSCLGSKKNLVVDGEKKKIAKYFSFSIKCIWRICLNIRTRTYLSVCIRNYLILNVLRLSNADGKFKSTKMNSKNVHLEMLKINYVMYQTIFVVPTSIVVHF